MLDFFYLSLLSLATQACGFLALSSHSVFHENWIQVAGRPIACLLMPARVHPVPYRSPSPTAWRLGTPERRSQGSRERSYNLSNLTGPNGRKPNKKKTKKNQKKPTWSCRATKRLLQAVTLHPSPLSAVILAFRCLRTLPFTSTSPSSNF